MSDWKWDMIYANKDMAAYPDNMLVRFVAKNFYAAPNRKDVKFFDVGCGAGASTWYLAREGFSVAAIDNSMVAINRLRKRLADENLEAFMACGDITRIIFKENYFDAVIDVSSLCYVPQKEIKELMQHLHHVLKPGGKFFSISPCNDCAREPFNLVINKVKLDARFMTYPEIYDSFRDFKEIKLKTYNYEVDRVDGMVKLWVVEAEK